MMNAKEELLDVLRMYELTTEDISYGYVELPVREYGVIPDGAEDIKLHFDGPITEDQLEMLNVEYDDGYGGQELFGAVVFKDGSWLERGEYDGSEWWEYKRTPSKKDLGIKEIK